MAETYTSKYATGAAVDAALDKAESALQPLDRRYAASGAYIYLGTAPADTLDSATGWTLTRLTCDATGAVTATETASDAWDDRATATYS